MQVSSLEPSPSYATSSHLHNAPKLLWSYSVETQPSRSTSSSAHESNQRSRGFGNEQTQNNTIPQGLQSIVALIALGVLPLIRPHTFARGRNRLILLTRRNNVLRREGSISDSRNRRWWTVTRSPGGGLVFVTLRIARRCTKIVLVSWWRWRIVLGRRRGRQWPQVHARTSCVGHRWWEVRQLGRWSARRIVLRRW